MPNLHRAEAGGCLDGVTPWGYQLAFHNRRKEGLKCKERKKNGQATSCRNIFNIENLVSMRFKTCFTPQKNFSPIPGVLLPATEDNSGEEGIMS